MAGIASEIGFGRNQRMKLSILAAVLSLLTGCVVHDRGRIRNPPDAPVAENRDAAIPRETAAAPKEFIVVSDPSPPPPVLNSVAKVEQPDPARLIAETNGRLLDIYFDYDRAELKDDALPALRKNTDLLAPILKDFPHVDVWIEGHCDERGSAEYNLGLGDNRAGRVAEILRGLGLNAARLHTVSYGKEMPQCTEQAEACWQKNRRAHFIVRESN